MKTQKTRAQLREAIALKRGWESQDNETWWVSPENLPAANLPDYLGSMDAALSLLRELRRGELSFYEDCVLVSWAPREGISRASGGLKMVKAPIGKEAEAACLAWWQFTTGEVVELVEESA